MSNEQHPGLTHDLAEYRKIARTQHYADKPKVLMEGDSWFSYPREWLVGFGEARNLCKWLHKKTRRRWLICEFAKNGDLLLNMFSKKHSDELVQVVESNKFDFFLISAGGNDVVGESCQHPDAKTKGFERLLKKAPAGSAAEKYLRMNEVDELMDKMRKRLLDAVRRCLAKRKNPHMQILTHTYAWPYADKGSFAPGKLWEQGPWFACGFQAVGLKLNSVTAREVIKILLERWADELQKLKAALPEAVRDDFTIVDTFHDVKLKKSDWNDEMHLTSDGYEKVFAPIYEELKARKRRARGR